jgi:hypothetical protein
MERYRRLFAALERIFGKGYVSRLMGKQSNVITLPDKQARKFLDTELNVMEASEGAVKKGIQDLETVISDTKRLSTLNDQELLTITNNAERLAVKVNPPAPPPAPTADVLSITTKVNKNKDPNVLIDEYNKNQTRLRLTDDEGGTAISYDEFRKLQSRNNEIEKTLESLNVKPALDEVKPEGIVIPFTKKPKESGIKSLKQEERSIDDYVDDAGGVNKDDPRGLDDFFDNPEDFATGGRVGMAGGGITALKSIIKFLAKNRGFGPTTGSKSLQELNPKQFGWKFNLLSPELKKSMEQNRLEYLENLSDAIKSDKKLLTDIKNMPKEWQEFMYKSANEGANQGRLDVYKKINIDDAISEIEQMKKNLEFKNLPGKEIKRRMNAEGGVSQGLDYLTGIERRGYAGGSILKTIGKKIIKKTKKPNLKRQLTDDEIDDLAADVGDLDAYLDFDGTVGSAEKIRKQHKEYMDYMYYQYKTGRLDPKPGEMNTSRMQYLRNKRKQAEMTDDPKLFNPNERDELDNLEETFSPMGTSNKINISDPKTAESFTEFAKQNDPEGFKKIEKIVDDINNKNTLENFDITGRKKNAKGGLNYLMGL